MNHSIRQLALWLAALFVTILGAKLWVIQIFATNMPYWDQWDEARYFFQPWLEGRLTWDAWFAPHNEHRIFFTRALDWLELWLNGQWDPRLQMVVNAMIHAGYACGLAFCLWFFTGKKQPGRICFLLAPLFVLPFAAENTVHGFQSQMYLLGIFSLAAMLGLGFGRVGGGAWLAGAALAVLAIFTMGSGFLASAAVVGLVACRSLKQRRCTRNDLITAAVALAVLALGLALNVTVEEHHKFQAKSVGIFFWVFESCLAWPFADWPWLCPLICLPLAILAFEYFRGNIKDSRAAEFVLLLAGWSMLQVAALAYGRSSLSSSSRYFDTLSILPIANIAAFWVLHDNGIVRTISARLWQALVLAWMGMLLAGLWQVSETGRTMYLPHCRAWGLLEEMNVRAFIATDDLQQLKNKSEQAVPYPNPDQLVELLRDKKILAILPPECRRPLPLENDSPASSGFIRDGFAPEKPKQAFTETWGSFTTNGASETGTFLSQPLQSRFPRLLLPVCCGDEVRSLQVKVVAADGRKIELSLRPTAGHWHDLIFTPPPGPFRLEVTDTSDHSWIAIGAMKEAGRLSVVALWLTQQAVWILLVGLAGFVFLTGRKLYFWKGGWPEGLILLLVAGVFIGVWCARQNDGATQAAKLQKFWVARAIKMGDWPAAQRHLREALWSQPYDPETLCRLAEQTLAHPDLPAAEARRLATVYCRAALKLKPDFPAAQACLHRMKN